MSTVIRVENLSKYYRLGLIGGGTLREDLNRWWAKVRGQPDPLLRIGETDHGNRKDGQIWALRDVNLEVQEGEILGIIGRNGAGKSTLLKILSRITAPTSGRVKIRGRVGSLLEVGTGFHPELTGRENIYLNGTILGMSRAEVDRKLDEIIDFAEITQFIDTPVKRYSSGMTVRLAFAVAAHLEPEILIVDEVLAVGDAAFQKKCLGKMQDVSAHGRTVLFVSHNMGSVVDLCTKATRLDKGTVTREGDPKEVVESYLAGELRNVSDMNWQLRSAPGDFACRLIAVAIWQGNKKLAGSPALITQPIEFRVTVYAEIDSAELGVGLFVYNTEGKLLVQSSSILNRQLRYVSAGHHTLSAELPAYLLNAGSYVVAVGADIPHQRIVFLESSVVSFDVTMNCPDMGRYGAGDWKGLTGPGVCAWREKDD